MILTNYVNNKNKYVIILVVYDTLICCHLLIKIRTTHWIKNAYFMSQYGKATSMHGDISHQYYNLQTNDAQSHSMNRTFRSRFITSLKEAAQSVFLHLSMDVSRATSKCRSSSVNALHHVTHYSNHSQNEITLSDLSGQRHRYLTTRHAPIQQSPHSTRQLCTRVTVVRRRSTAASSTRLASHRLQEVMHSWTSFDSRSRFTDCAGCKKKPTVLRTVIGYRHLAKD